MHDLPWGQPGRFWKGNLHAHSNFSDGVLPLDEVVAGYRRQGYDFLAVTEHFNAQFGYAILDTSRYRTDAFTTLIGAELEGPELEIGGIWYLNAIGLPLDFAPSFPEEPLADLGVRAAEAGAFVSVACPVWCGVTVADVQRVEAAQAVEVYNETCAVHNDRGDSWHLVDTLAALGRRLTGYACDDSHFLPSRPDAYRAWVEVRAAALVPDALLNALKAGHFYSTQGPSIHEVAIEEGKISISCSPTNSIIVSGRGWTAEALHGYALTGAEFSVEQFASSYCRVTVIDGTGKRAWSNPIWFS